jgi:Ca2+-binding EF-hand superfamily protein
MTLRDEAQWKSVWQLYDEEKKGTVSKQNFASALRVLGHRYTLEQMNKITSKLLDQIDYETYIGVLGDPYDGPTTDDLLHALRAFDGKDSGELTVSQIESILTTMGDKIPAEDAKAILEMLPNDKGKVKIPQLVHFLTPPIPSAKPNIPELLKDLMREEWAKIAEEQKQLDTMEDVRCVDSQESTATDESGRSEVIDDGGEL